ncbi:telomere-binding alpha subunit central domain protein [Aspergillus bombycis]|uniref:Protection of telomeres protein 1 n=1 Tax=Aspergillus bombycis TaxID=109264 RepID=A0A1F7ZPZ4_9EURO|nr:telomere-binding alpha subunit central domain protein [Aspergillus bombycis]OGM41530.1 telomere-binding alpha subunit central domain protein [Aspergillus bombycis]
MANNSSSSTVIDIPAALRSQGNVTVIGVVVDVFQGVFKTSNSLCITFTLKSDNLKNGHVWDGLKVKYFKDNESHLPPVQEGDVVLLRNLWIRNYNGKPLGIAGDRANVPWAIFRFDPDPLCTNAPISGPTPFEPSYTEKRRCQSLLESITGLSEFRNASAPQVTAPQSFTSQASSSTQDARTQRKLTAIKDIREGTLVDLIGEVVKLYPQNSEKALLYLSDYTTNKKLQDHTSIDDDLDGDSFYRSRKKWTGPPGQMSLPVTLWEPHASFAREYVKEDDIISLKYVHIKANRHNLTLEASMHNARYNNVHLVDPEKNDHAKELLRRKKDYYRGINTGKRKAEEDAKPTDGLKARNKKRLGGMREESEATRQLKERNKPNEHVKASYEGVRGRRIEDIVTSEFHEFESHDGVEYRLPFQNLCYKTTVRVVDFFPPDIKDFAVRQQPKENHSGSSMYRNAEDDGITRWEWRFCLLIEDALPPPPGQPKEQIKLFVSDANAEFLLKMSATDLRKDSEQLAILRERLFILWGDLEERKKTNAEESGQGPPKLDRASSRPFVCCIQEYGVKCSHLSDADAMSDNTSGCSREDCFGWERRFGMFQTTIDL